MKYYLGIDNGGTITKAAIYSYKGEEIGVSSVKTKLITPQPDFTERDMVEMREANFEVIRKVIKKTKINPSQICGIACCGHGKGLYLWGKDNKPVRPGIISTDNRAWEFPLRWKKDGTAEKVFKKTYQKILACQPVSLIAWLKKNEPESISKIKWIFECKDYVRFCLTNEAYAEITDYSGTNFVNLITREYDDELLELFDIKDLKECLPPIKKSTDICGYITEYAASKTGLREGTPVAAGMFDIDACAVAVNVTEEDRVCMIAGTWSINEYISKTPITDGSVMMNSVFCRPEYYLIEESSPTSASNNEWFINTFLPELMKEANSNNESIYDITNSWIDSVEKDEFYPFFLPFLMASNVHPNAKACFIGISNYHTRAHILKSVYEGIIFSHKFHLENLMKSREKPFKCIRLAGGMSRSSQWVQMFADVMQLPVEVAEIGETGTLGCAINVAVALNDYSSFKEAAQNMVQIKKTIFPNKNQLHAFQ